MRVGLPGKKKTVSFAHRGKTGLRPSAAQLLRKKNWTTRKTPEPEGKKKNRAAELAKDVNQNPAKGK